MGPGKIARAGRRADSDRADTLTAWARFFRCFR
jgi:hypothetical protein